MLQSVKKSNIVVKNLQIFHPELYSINYVKMSNFS